MKNSDHEILKGYYWNHNAIRKDTERLNILAEKADSFTAKGFEMAAKWLDFHKFAIISHHEGEDEFFFPKISERTTEFEEELAKFDHEHQELDNGLKWIERVLNVLSVEPKQEDIDELKRAIFNYVMLVENHLASEEAVVESAINNHFTKEEAKQAEEEFRSSLPREKIVKLMPWMVDAMDDKDRKFFFSQVPLIARVMYHVSLKGKFNRLTEPVSP